MKDTAAENPHSRQARRRFFLPHYEYKSKKTLFHLPLVHIHFGYGFCRARGVVAIGNIATGFLSIGFLSFGLLSIGALAAGLFCFGGVAVGGLAIGGFAAGAVAIGGLALGIFALGGLAAGMFATGGCAIASDIAAGGYASGHIAIGNTVRGMHTIAIHSRDPGGGKAQQVRLLIQQEYPHLWEPLADWFALLFR